jgi:hypothetical protein
MVEAYLGDNLELLALAVLRLGNGLLEAVDGLGVELLYSCHVSKTLVG